MANVSPEIEQVVLRGLQATKRYLGSLQGQDYIKAVGEIAILDTVRALPFSVKQVCNYKTIPVGKKGHLSSIDFNPEQCNACKTGIEDVGTEQTEPSHVHLHIHLPQTIVDKKKEVHIHVHTGDKEIDEVSVDNAEIRRERVRSILSERSSQCSRVSVQPGFVLSAPNTPDVTRNAAVGPISTPIVSPSVWSKSPLRERAYTESELISLDFETARDYIHKVKTTKGESAYLDLMEILINNEYSLKYPLSVMANVFEVTAQRIHTYPFDANAPFPIH